MSIGIKDAERLLGNLYSAVSEFNKAVGYDADNVAFDEYDPNEAFMHDQFSYIVNKLTDAEYRLKYLKGVVVDGGVLRMNKGNRFEVLSGKEWTSGEPIEYFDSECNMWAISRIEHGSNGYYIVREGQDKSLDGIKVRVRERVW